MIRLAKALICYAATATIALCVNGCLPGTSEGAFVGSRSEVLCQGVYQQCQGKVARCRLDEDKYITGEFPGGQTVLVETPPGDWTIRVLLFLDPAMQPRSPGTETEINWYEPGCADQYRFQLSHDGFGQDLFEEAGPDNVFEVAQAVVETGDHLVEVFSDARTRYLLRVEAKQVD